MGSYSNETGIYEWFFLSTFHRKKQWVNILLLLPSLSLSPLLPFPKGGILVSTSLFLVAGLVISCTYTTALHSCCFIIVPSNLNSSCATILKVNP